MADLHRRLQEAQGTGVLHLVSHVALGAGAWEGLRGEVNTGLTGVLLASPGQPAQLPKEKEKNCHQGHATYNHHHSKEAARGTCPAKARHRGTEREAEKGAREVGGAHIEGTETEEKRRVMRRVPSHRRCQFRGSTQESTAGEYLQSHVCLMLHPQKLPFSSHASPGSTGGSQPSCLLSCAQPGASPISGTFR